MTAGEIAYRTEELVRSCLERAGRTPSPLRGGAAAGSRAGGAAILPEPLFDSFRDRARTTELWKELFPGAPARAAAVAAGVLENRIPLFSGVAECGDSIDWHRDYRSGVRSPLAFYRDVRTLDPRTVGDAKYTWELNRFGYLVPLGMAHWAGGGAVCYDKWKELIGSWVESNPFNRGVNWSSSLELAFRAINWIWSSYFFREELAEDPATQRLLRDALLLHGDHIYHHLSYYFSPNTHLTGEALGLLYIGKSYPGSPGAKRWAERGARILETELRRQILADGGYFERATYYHKYTIDFYVHYLLLAGARPAPRGETEEIVKRTIVHCALLAAHDGEIPLVGDSDGGRLLFLDGEKSSVRGACCAAAAILGDGELKGLAGGAFPEEALWLLGARGLERYRRVDSSRRDSYHSMNDETGWFCFRQGPGAGDSSLTIDCGPHGWGRCGHAHADLLSVLWNDRGTSVLVDQGNATYGGDVSLRNRTRSSQCHNTITLGGASQSIPAGVFDWERIARPAFVYHRLQGAFGYFEGEHDAYRSVACGHKRIVLHLGNELAVVADLVRCREQVSALLFNLQLAEGSADALGRNLFRFTAARDGSAHYLRFFGPVHLAPEIADGAVYPDYGSIVPAPRIVIADKGVRGDVAIVTLLSSDRGLLESFSYDGSSRLAGASRARRYELSFEPLPADPEASRDEVVPARVTAAVEEGGKTLSFRRNADGADGWTGALEISRGVGV